MSSMDFDVVVIGSGFGGAVTACRLSEAGYGVLVLERGRRWQSPLFPRAQGDATDFPRGAADPWIYDVSRPQRDNGWIDFRTFPHMSVVMGAGVGGGSLIYANVSVNPAPGMFDSGWPAEISWQEIQPHLQAVGDMLEVSELPDRQLTQRFKLVREGAEAIGEADRFAKLPLAVNFDEDWTYAPINGENPRQEKFAKRFVNAHGIEQGTCVHLGTCDVGCATNARNSVDVNYLARAEAHGTEIRPLRIVRRIEPTDGGYTVVFDRIDLDTQELWPESVTGRLVVVACGSLGSTELLLRCRDEHRTLPDLSPYLGHNWSSNGDFLTPAIHNGRRISPTEGPTISGRIDFVDQPVDGEHFFIQDGGFPDVGALWLRDHQDGKFGHRLLQATTDFVRQSLAEADTVAGDSDPFSELMPWFAQGQDNADGVLRLKRRFPAFWRRKLHLDWDIEESGKTINTIIDMHTRLAQATGGKPLVPLPWTLFRDLITPHPLGGCNMSEPLGSGGVWTDAGGRPKPADRGVVDHRGEAFGYTNLFVADGAVIPEAIGRNPSRTIAAVAERIAAVIIDEQR